MQNSVRTLLHAMTQNQQVLVGSLELDRWPSAMAAARHLEDQTGELITLLATLEKSSGRDWQ